MAVQKKSRSNQEWLDVLLGKHDDQAQERALLEIGNHLYPKVHHLLRTRQRSIPYLRRLSPMELAEEAQDFIQSMFLEKLIPDDFAHLKKFSGNGGFVAWITKVQLNYTIDQLRKKNMEVVDSYIILNEPDPSPPPEEQIGLDEVMDVLNGCAKVLTPGRYEVFVTHFVNGESARSIADALGKKRSQIHTLIFHTRRNIRKCLAGKGINVDILNDLF